MKKGWAGKVALGVAGIMLFVGGWVLGQQTRTSQAATEKTLMHVFAFTPREGATEQDFANFHAATADMVGKIPGLRRAWFGKLLQPLPPGPEPRLYGVAMEFDDVNALQVYADHPAHRAWEQVYAKVRVPGTTTLDIPGE